MAATTSKGRKLDWYKQNKDEVLRARLIKKIREHLKDPNVAALKIRKSTLVKYGLYDDENDRLTIPKRYEPAKIVYNDETLTQPQVINVVVRTKDEGQSPIEVYNNSNTEVNGKQLIDWILTELAKQPINAARMDTNIRAKKTIQTYVNYTKQLFKYQK